MISVVSPSLTVRAQPLEELKKLSGSNSERVEASLLYSSAKEGTGSEKIFTVFNNMKSSVKRVALCFPALPLLCTDAGGIGLLAWGSGLPGPRTDRAAAPSGLGDRREGRGSDGDAGGAPRQAVGVCCSRGPGFGAALPPRKLPRRTLPRPARGARARGPGVQVGCLRDAPRAGTAPGPRLDRAWTAPGPRLDRAGTALASPSSEFAPIAGSAGSVAVEGAPPMRSPLLPDLAVLLSKYDSLFFSGLLSAPPRPSPEPGSPSAVPTPEPSQPPPPTPPPPPPPPPPSPIPAST
ncbi:WAS/WASL-interacting protein family member 3-like [Vulpes lagopus]|uniref:WAS/WASL-interacting protein family member 3-like n=1 Tax=Vulpes lagopus TaxID=494514 RepID=UPI001BCA2204|nr:WAS/WASL-interacting protein family member 3-like [Vulpes lagopus]